MAKPTPTDQPPGTPGFPQEQLAAATLAGVAIISQFVPLKASAQEGIVDVVQIVAPTIVVAGTAVRVGRQKWWRNFMEGDFDRDPSTPPSRVPVPVLVALGVAVLVALAMAVALVVVLV